MVADLDPFSQLGLLPIRPADQLVFDEHFAALSSPLSDYTFSQLFSWSNSLRIFWKRLRNHLCVFANGTGDLTLLMPPIGDTNSDAALAEAAEVMDAYNQGHGVPHRSRVEYASEELLRRFDTTRLELQPMGGDYLYDAQQMIDLPGGALASKRQLKNRFTRLYDYQVEPFDSAAHLDDCRKLLALWKDTQDAHHTAGPSTSALKRQKESTACDLALQHAPALGLAGLVVYTRPKDAAQPLALSGFTFGEPLGRDQASIVIEKTDLSVRGLAQFIFSEFCRLRWSHLPFINAGDDWGLESLAWTKQSYRPVRMLNKYSFKVSPRIAIVIPHPPPELEQAIIPIPPPSPLPALALTPPPVVTPASHLIRHARPADLPAARQLEEACFTAHRLSSRQLRYLHRRQSTVFIVAEHDNQLVGQAIALTRRHKNGQLSGRIYSLAVHPDHRRQKLGQRLIHALIEGLAARGVRHVYLEVSETNSAAIALYRSLGFQPLGDLPNYYGHGDHALHMRLQLPTPQLAA